MAPLPVPAPGLPWGAGTGTPAPQLSRLHRAGVLRLVKLPAARGYWSAVALCGGCDTEKVIHSRGLCNHCYWAAQRHGTLDEYGYTKTARMADFAVLRARGLTIGQAAARVEVTERTGNRYELELDAAGLAPWRAHDEYVLWAARRKYSQSDRLPAVSTG